MTDSNSLLGQFLIAQPTTKDRYFDQAVIIVCSHSDQQGAWGLVCNRPITDPERSREVWQYLGWAEGYHPLGMDLWAGGPVLPDRVIVLHSTDWRSASTQELTLGVLVTQDPSVFEAIHSGQGPSEYKIFLGFAAWQAGQLEGEQSGQPPWTPQHRWLISPSRAQEILSVDSQESQWLRAIAQSARLSVDSWF